MRRFRRAMRRGMEDGSGLRSDAGIQVNASGAAVHPLEVQGGEKGRKVRMKCIAPSGRSDRPRPFPHVLSES